VLGTDGLWLEERDWPSARGHAADLLDEYGFIVRHLAAVLLDNLDTFFGLQELHELLLEIDAGYPIPLADRLGLVRVLRALLRERVPVTSLPVILGAYAEHQATGADLLTVIEHVRLALRSELVEMQSTFDWLDLTPEFEEIVRRGVRAAPGYPYLVLEPGTGARLVSAVRTRRPERGRPIGIVVQDPALRPFVRRLLEAELAAVPVLSERELDDDIVATGDPVGCSGL
jgi:type III secretion protein V